MVIDLVLTAWPWMTLFWTCSCTEVYLEIEIFRLFSPKRVISRKFLDIFDHSLGQSDHNHLKNVQFVSHMSIGRKQTRQKTHFFRKISRNLEIFDRIKTTKYFSPDIIGLKFLGISHFLFSRVYLRWFNKLSKLVMREQTRIEMF